jgi:DNA-binding NtrC family response regulator
MISSGMSSDPTRTVDAEADSGRSGPESALELSLLWLTGERGNLRLELVWRGASELIIGRDDECAIRASEGFFRAASGGTLLLDEVTDLPLLVQAKLLRTLEQKEVQPLGETKPVGVDVRVIVAGQQSLLEAVQKQKFRPDLLARLNGFAVRLPPLRERREDILPLLLRFLGSARSTCAPRIEPDFCERLTLHDWPFNVRELLVLAKRLAVFHGEEDWLRGQHLPPGMGDGSRQPSVALIRAELPESVEAEADTRSVSLGASTGSSLLADEL